MRTVLERSLPKMPFYAVARGRREGIYSTWSECQSQVDGFRGARYKKFSTVTEAHEFVNQNGVGGSRSKSSSNGASSGNSFASAIGCSAAQSSQPKKKTRYLPDAPTGRTVRHGQHDFRQDDDGYVQVFTDGSCEGNGKANAAAGLGVYFDEGHALNTSKPVSGRATNNCGEIQAASEAIRKAREQGITRLTINTDSKFLIDATTKWMAGWKRRNWTLANGGPVKNQTDFTELDRELNTGNMQVKWNHVDAHSGILGNERADRLARQGSEMYRAQRQRTNGDS